MIPKDTSITTLPPGYTVFEGEPLVRGCSVWSSIAYEPNLDRIYFGTGNAVPDGSIPSPGYSNGLMSLNATTGEFGGFFQVLPESNYRPSDSDIDVGASATIFCRQGVDNQWPGTNPTIARSVVGFACKNGSYFLLDADKMQLISWRQLLPYTNDGVQILRWILTRGPHWKTCRRHPEDPNSVHPPRMPQVTNMESNSTQGENFHGSYSCAAVDSKGFRLFVGLGGANYNFVGSGIDTPTTPFMRAFDWNTMADVWPFDDSDPKQYKTQNLPCIRIQGNAG